jgi:hypothetical protein
MDSLKYIIVQVGGLEIPIIFSSLLEHKKMGMGKNVVSAGFCDLIDSTNGLLEVTCWGSSTTLNVSSRKENDAEIIEKEIKKMH